MGIIYMATNTVNGKQYIGQTKMTLDARRRVHQARGNTSPFGLAIKKYGKSAFRWDVLHTGILDPEELDRLEYEEIRKRKTIAPRGYNIREGGNGTPIGVYGANARRAEEVICIETGARYRSMKEAGRAIGNSNIINVISNPYRKCGGYHWRYADDAKHENVSKKYIREMETIERIAKENRNKKNEADRARKQDPECQRIRHEHYRQAAIKRAEERTAKIRASKEWQDKQERKKQYAIRATPKPVLCVETGEVFASIRLVSKIIGVHQSTASQAINKCGRIKGKKYVLLQASA